MFRRIPGLVWLVTTIAALTLGIWPGIWLAQKSWIFMGVIVGWLYIPQGLYLFINNGFSSDIDRLQWFATLGYPLAMLEYSLLAYWVTHRTSFMRDGLMVTCVAALVSTAASIPIVILVDGVNQDVSAFRFSLDFTPAILIHKFILIHLLFSALLGWLMGSGIARLQARRGVAHSAA